MKKVKLAVIGVGRIGPVHMENLMRLSYMTEVVAVCDLIEEKAKHNAEIAGARPYLDYIKMLENEKIDAVYVTTPTNQHDYVVNDCANAGKHIFCEKPIAENIKKAKGMVECAKKNNVKLQVGYQRRFCDEHLGAKKLIDEGKIGKPLIFKSTSKDPFPPPQWALNPETGGGLYIDMNTHDFDLARWLMNDEIIKLYANDANLLDLKYDIPNLVDNAIVTFKYSRGAIGEVDGNWNSKGGNDARIEISGTEGTIFIGKLTSSPVYLFDENGLSNVFTFKTDKYPHFINRFREGYFNEDQAFVECVLHDKQPSVSGKDGLEALKISFAALESSRTGSVVTL
jgi:predicted dehydrogenase